MVARWIVDPQNVHGRVVCTTRPCHPWTFSVPAVGSSVTRAFVCSVRQQHAVDSNHDAVGRVVVASDTGTINAQAATHELDLHVIAGFRLRAAGALQIIRLESLTRHHVAGQDFHELVLVLRAQKGLELLRRQLGKCLVGRGKNRDRALGGQGVLQAGDFDGLGEGVEVTLLFGDIENRRAAGCLLYTSDAADE